MRFLSALLFSVLFASASSSNSNQNRATSAVDNVSADSIRSFLQELSREPHLAGSPRDLYLARWIEDNFRSFGLDHTQQDEYKTLLSYPDRDRPNKVRLLDDLGEVRFTSKHKEDVLRPEDDDPNFVDAFLAYTPAGTASGQLVYVNYGREEDLDLLEEMGVFVDGKIVIARYGFGFRGNKIRSCEDRGAIGVILFSDPADVTFGGQETSKVYPYTQFLPGSGIQRGGTKVNVAGDPLSPGWASVENAYRLPLEERQGLPNIPAQPIGYDDAKVLLKTLGGPLAPPEWIGGLQNLTYHVGGEFTDSYANWEVTLTTNNYFDDETRNVNVVGVILGAEEPDRYVILCNHRDAWGFGAVDPSGGTAAMLETARVLGEQVQSGEWRPKRSIVFVSWAAEEYGLLGSTEWVFHKMPKIAARAVAVVNVDSAAYGTFFYPKSSPSLARLPVEATKLLQNPLNASQSYYDYWKERLNLKQSKVREPESVLIGSGSDHDAFVFVAGIPAIDLRFMTDSVDFPGIFTNPTYHTGYETFFLVDEILDPGFLYHRLCAQVTTSILLDLADSDLLNFDFHGLVNLMRSTLLKLDADGTSSLLEENGASLQHLKAAVEEFDQSISNFTSFISTQDLGNPLVRRMINDQIMSLERIFIADAGLPGRSEARHLIYSPSKFNKYGSSAFPGLKDLLYEVNIAQDPDQVLDKWREIRRHVSDLMIAVKQAAEFLKPYERI